MAHSLGVVLWMAFGFSFVKQFGNLHSIFVIVFCFLNILYIPYLYELEYKLYLFFYLCIYTFPVVLPHLFLLFFFS